MLVPSQSPLGPVDLTPDIIYHYIDTKVGVGNCAYPPSLIDWFCYEIVHWTGVFGLRTSFVVAQILHETDFFRFTGDVDPEQFNFAGLGTTGGGVKGETIGKGKPDRERITLGVIAVLAHHLVYIYGKVDQWPADLRQYVTYDPRYSAVRAAGTQGTIKTIDDYGGKWAVDSGYDQRILMKANELLALMGAGPLKVFLLAGHHNTSGGNPVEHSITGELVEEIARAFRYQGADVIVGTPDGPDPDTDPGDGEFTGPLDAAALQVVDLANRGWVADYFGEVHTEGAGGRRGCFGIYPDWGDDVDVDARQFVIPRIIDELTKRTGLSKRNGTGLMSEKSTGVGGQGYRLGIFRVTAPIKAKTTRFIIEHGAHDSMDDLAIIQSPGFNKAAAVSWVIGCYSASGVPLPKDWDGYLGAASTPSPQTADERYFPETGFKVVAGFKGFYEKLEQFNHDGAPLSLLMLGYPTGNEYAITLEGDAPGALQTFERGCLMWDSRVSHPWEIVLLPISAYKERGIV